MAGLDEWRPSRQAATLLAIVALGAFAGPASAAEVPDGEEAIVVLRDGPAENAARKSLRAATAGLDVVRVIPDIGVASVDLPAGTTVGELRNRLADDPAVAAVEPNLVLDLRAAPPDPAYAASDPLAPGADAYQWHLRKSGFERAWARSTGERARVAVIDTGAAAAHPDLGPRIEAAFDKDDTLLHGGADLDENGHGSHVSGLACGQSGDDFGIASAGYACDLTIYKTDLSVASIAESIVEATDRGVDVINMSFGGQGTSKALHNAVDRAVEADLILVAAADNRDTDEDGNPTSDQGIPASYLQPVGTGPDIERGDGLVVTAAQYDGNRAWFGPGRGTGISLAAYGSAGQEYRGIFSTFPPGVTEIETVELCAICRGSFDGDDRFAYLEGTSMATPQVSGAAALIRHRKPNMSAERVISLLKRNATRSGGYSEELGWGVLNANRALRAALEKKRR
jgi:serine protease